MFIIFAIFIFPHFYIFEYLKLIINQCHCKDISLKAYIRLLGHTHQQFHFDYLIKSESTNVCKIYISGQIPINPQTNLIDKPQIQWQTHQVMKNLTAALTGANSSLKSILKTTILLTNMQNFAKVNEIYGSYFAQGQYPARICFSVKQLPKGSLIQVQAIGVIQNIISGECPTKKVKLSSDL